MIVYICHTRTLVKFIGRIQLAFLGLGAWYKVSSFLQAYQIGFEVLSPGSDKVFLYCWYMSQVVEQTTERVPQPMV